MKNQLVSILVCGDCIISRENSISIIKIVEKVLIKDKGTYPFWIYICLRNITGEHKLQVIYKNNQGKQVEVRRRPPRRRAAAPPGRRRCGRTARA